MEFNLNAIKQEMKARGATDSQLNSKTLIMVMEIFMDNNDLFKETIENTIKDYKDAIAKHKAEADKAIDLQKKYTDALAGIPEREKHLRQLAELETKEARDKLRLSSAFVEQAECYISTKENQSMYIQALGNILS